MGEKRSSSEPLKWACSLSDDSRMENATCSVTRWRRFGKDRLYVERPDGAKVGWWDLTTNEAHPERQDDLPALTHAVDNWMTDQVDNGSEAGAPAPNSGGTVDLTPTASTAPPTIEQPSAPDREPDLAPLPVTKSTKHNIAAEAATRPWVDLSTNRAGAEAREQAQAARDAAPVKTVLARVLGVHTDERAWRIGADGEELVAAQLAKAAKKDPRWRALHAIPVGERGSDIDHLVVGPGGVFTVNAKHHPKAKIWVGGNTFMVNGNRQPYIRNSRHEAARAAKLLTAACGFPVHVEGLIVTVNAADVVIKTQPEGVSVTWRNDLAKWILRHGDIHTPEALNAIYEAARRSTTWRP